MSLKCPSPPIYYTSAEQKLKSKNAAKLYRFGTPKLRDLLREKCRVRVREARQCRYQETRALGNEAQQQLHLSDILRQELAELEQDIDLQQEIYKELIDEFNEWFVEQQDEEDCYLIDVVESNAVICPVCQRYTLESDMQAAGGECGNYNYKCKCGQSFRFAGGNMAQLNLVLQDKINLHEQKCLRALSFFVEPCLSAAKETPTTSTAPVAGAANGNILNAMCDACDYFCSL